MLVAGELIDNVAGYDRVQEVATGRTLYMLQCHSNGRYTPTTYPGLYSTFTSMAQEGYSLVDRYFTHKVLC